MKRKGELFKRIATLENFYSAVSEYESDKMKRRKVIKFNKDLAKNVADLYERFKNGTWSPLSYKNKIIYEHGKKRELSIYPIEEHVVEWAILLWIEDLLCGTYIRNSFACVRGRGQTDFVKRLYHELYTDKEGTRYGVQIDVHHYFPSINLDILKKRLSDKIKDKELLEYLYMILDNHPGGLVLGTKLSQIEGNFYLAKFDHDMINLFDLNKRYYQNIYVNDKIGTSRTREDLEELGKGILYLNEKFDRLWEDWKKGQKYFRFADNIVMLSEDKTFLHILVRVAKEVLKKDYDLEINRSWNVRPMTDGLDVCGYVFYPDHIRVRKRIKEALQKKVRRLKKKGYDDNKIFLEVASQLGWCMHADSRQLIKSLDIGVNMIALGTVNRNKKNFKAPFSGMDYSQKISITKVVNRKTDTSKDEDYITLELSDYKVTKRKDGTDLLIIRFKVIDKMVTNILSDGKVEVKPLSYKNDGREYFSYTGSSIIIDNILQWIPDGIKNGENRPFRIFSFKKKAGYGEYLKISWDGEN